MIHKTSSRMLRLKRAYSRFGVAAVLAIATCFDATAQAVDLPLSHEAYAFMDRMEARGFLSGFQDAIRPLPRLAIARHLLTLHDRQQLMTQYEIEEYAFLLQEFTQELCILRPDSLANVDRWRAGSFDVAGGKMNVGLNLVLEARRSGGDALDKRTLGVQVFGHAVGKLGYYFNYTQTNEKGALVNGGKLHTPEQGVPYFGLPRQFGFEYNVSQAGMSYDFGPVDVSLEQTMNAWGNERYGNLILSIKAPSYPKFKLRAALTDWLKFTYIHAELHSNVVDSLRTYDAGTSSIRTFFRTVYRSKFMAVHTIELSAWNLFDFTIGESVVYSDRGPLLMYLLPISFFKSGEHYNRDTDNTQLFASVEVPVGHGLALQGSLFIDELSVVDLGDPVRQRNQLGFSVGANLYDMPLDNFELFVEYTRLNPWVYSHKYETARFTNNGFTMGHWIGQNADLLSAELLYRPTRASRVSVLYQIYRKGDTTDVVHQYSPPAEPFLFGRQRIDRALTVTLSYQFLRDAFAEFEYRSGTLDDQQRTVPLNSSSQEYAFRIRYGLW